MSCYHLFLILPPFLLLAFTSCFLLSVIPIIFSITFLLVSSHALFPTYRSCLLLSYCSLSRISSASSYFISCFLSSLFIITGLLFLHVAPFLFIPRLYYYPDVVYFLYSTSLFYSFLSLSFLVPILLLLLLSSLTPIFCIGLFPASVLLWSFALPFRYYSPLLFALLPYTLCFLLYCHSYFTSRPSRSLPTLFPTTCVLYLFFIAVVPIVVIFSFIPPLTPACYSFFLVPYYLFVSIAYVLPFLLLLALPWSSLLISSSRFVVLVFFFLLFWSS